MSNENNSENLRQLLDKEEWTEEERRWLLHFLDTSNHTELRQLMQEKFDADSGIIQPEAKAEHLLSLIHNKIDAEKQSGKLHYINRWKRVMAAAAIVLVLSMGAVVYLYQPSRKDNVVAQVKTPHLPQYADIEPGRNAAILTLSDGSKIVLDSAANGTLAKEGNSEVLKIDGQIAYRNTGSKMGNGKLVYNTVSTARGNQYKLVLADGSKVWLNAASSVRFPAGFSTKERRVEISGEAYFEVAPSYVNGRKIPFIVKVNTSQNNGYEVQVLGTHFNINAYDDEPAIRTTLAEGKVKVNKGSHSVLLEPAQQAVLSKAGKQLDVQPAVVEAAIAWKIGMFEFQDANLHSIMRQLARWYDVDVTFSGVVSDKLYNGSIRRQATLSQVLQILKLAGVNYTLKGRELIIGAY